MEARELRAKLNGILEAIAAGKTCEQILEEDHALTYNDIFHAVAEAPTSYWDKATVKHPVAKSAETVDPLPTPIRHLTD